MMMRRLKTIWVIWLHNINIYSNVICPETAVLCWTSSSYRGSQFFIYLFNEHIDWDKTSLSAYLRPWSRETCCAVCCADHCHDDQQGKSSQEKKSSAWCHSLEPTVYLIVANQQNPESSLTGSPDILHHHHFYFSTPLLPYSILPHLFHSQCLFLS